MLWTLYRYILRDLLKLLVLSTAVLVIIISFAVAVKYLAEGLLGPLTLIRFVLYTIPTVLGFALPFAGAFASTLVFSRLTADNEITACLASGISYAKILAPVFGLGLALTMGLFFLSNFIVPTFYRWAAQTVQTDVMTALVHQLDQHRAFVMKGQGIAIYADEANMEPAPHLPHAEIQPSQYVQLQGVAAVRFDRHGRREREATAQRASVLLFKHKHDSWVTIRLRNCLFYDPSKGMFDGGFWKTADLQPIQLPKPFNDNPKFLSWPQLRQLSAHPQQNDRVRARMQSLRQALIDAKLHRLILDHLASSRHQVTLQGPMTGQRYIVRCPRLANANQSMTLQKTARTPVEVIDQNPGAPARRYRAASGTLTITDTGFAARPRVQIQLTDVKIHDPRDRAHIATAPSITLPTMLWPKTLRISTADLRNAAKNSDSPRVQAATAALSDQILNLVRDIISRLHIRAASAVSCLLLLGLGAVMSMKLVGQMPLVVYMWSFILAIVTILIINTGGHMASGTTYSLTTALSVLWLGNVMLAVVLGTLYCWLARH